MKRLSIYTMIVLCLIIVPMHGFNFFRFGTHVRYHIHNFTRLIRAESLWRRVYALAQPSFMKHSVIFGSMGVVSLSMIKNDLAVPDNLLQQRIEFEKYKKLTLQAQLLYELHKAETFNEDYKKIGKYVKKIIQKTKFDENLYLNGFSRKALIFAENYPQSFDKKKKIAELFLNIFIENAQITGDYKYLVRLEKALHAYAGYPNLMQIKFFVQQTVLYPLLKNELLEVRQRVATMTKSQEKEYKNLIKNLLKGWFWSCEQHESFNMNREIEKWLKESINDTNG